jgi:very-short-patch-repair endonuclease
MTTITAAAFRAMQGKANRKAYQIDDLQFSALSLPPVTKEYRFHPVRKWRIDFAWPALKLAMEIEGGLFVKGAHGRGAHYRSDCEKYNALAEMGWTLLRYLPNEIDWVQVKNVINRLQSENAASLAAKHF